MIGRIHHVKDQCKVLEIGPCAPKKRFKRAKCDNE